MIFVTGAGGTVGSEVVRALSNAGAKLRAGYSSEEKAAKARGLGIDAAAADFSQPDTLPAVLRGCDHLFLLGATAPNQTELEIGVVRAARDAGIQHVVKLSVWGAEEEAFTFARLHRPVERFIESSGLGWTFLRPNGFMQNLVNFLAAAIKSQNTLYQPARNAAISHVDVRDIAAVAVRALTSPGHVGRAYVLSGPEAVTYGQIAEKLTALLGREISYVDMPDDAAKQVMLGMGISEWYANAMLDLVHYYVAGRASRVTQAVREVTGRDAISYDRFLADHIAALR